MKQKGTPFDVPYQPKTTAKELGGFLKWVCEWPRFFSNARSMPND
jgi:hypothetical protein